MQNGCIWVFFFSFNYVCRGCYGFACVCLTVSSLATTILNRSSWCPVIFLTAWLQVIIFWGCQVKSQGHQKVGKKNIFGHIYGTNWQKEVQLVPNSIISWSEPVNLVVHKSPTGWCQTLFFLFVRLSICMQDSIKTSFQIFTNLDK